MTRRQQGRRTAQPARAHRGAGPRSPAPPPPREALAPEAGRWLWTCRAGFEPQLFEELAWRRARPRLLAEALIESDAVAGDPPTFARTGFPVTLVAGTPQEVAGALPLEPLKLQVWVPDTELANARAGEAATWEAGIASTRRAVIDLETPWKAFEAGAWLAQVCLIAPGLAAVGQVRARDAVSLAAGGRARMKKTADAPSRAALKLDEALEWHGVAPGRGELCVDLGAAPGGWTRRLVERGARVWSVDPARLEPSLAQHGKVTHFVSSAFDFEPTRSVDFLCCDMAWRPLEVAQLLGKWARRGWAAQLVANFKLPMRDKLPMVTRVRAVLEDAGWRRVRTRQLYHDRDEVTVSARLGG